jgi:guanosine-3',5'-bis(diphosphate) 3'-pyrophosphohydrolase
MNAYNLVNAARDMAIRAHEGQTYPPGDSKRFMKSEGYHSEEERTPLRLPFTAHLGHVVGVLHRFGLGQDQWLVAAAWLHDTLEDTQLKPFLIRDACGEEVLRLVEAVTDEPGANRAEKKAKTYPKIVAVGEAAVDLKLADRIANVEASILGGCGFDFLTMYRKEYPEFKAALRVLGMPEMWMHLNSYLE